VLEVGTPSRPHAVDVPERYLLSADDLSKLIAPMLARLVVVAARSLQRASALAGER
jgi:hypothetical protein